MLMVRYTFYVCSNIYIIYIIPTPPLGGGWKEEQDNLFSFLANATNSIEGFIIIFNNNNNIILIIYI